MGLIDAWGLQYVSGLPYVANSKKYILTFKELKLSQLNI